MSSLLENPQKLEKAQETLNTEGWQYICDHIDEIIDGQKQVLLQETSTKVLFRTQGSINAFTWATGLKDALVMYKEEQERTAAEAEDEEEGI